VKSREFAALAGRKNKGNARGATHVLLHGVEHKSCADCGSLVPLANYSHDKSHADGLYSYCKACDAKRAAERYARKRGAA